MNNDLKNEATSGRPKGFWSRRALFFGVERDINRRWGIHFKKRFYFFAFSLVFIFSFAGLAAYSTSPSFCRSCHIMEPYYQAWANSKHSDVPCVECHYPPASAGTIIWKKFQALSQVVKFITRTYSSKPYAEVEDSSCLREGCHATRLLQGKLETAKGIRFDHKPHLENVKYGRQLRCVSCHSQIVVGKHIEVTYDSCYLCHFKGRHEGRTIDPIGGCQGCHKMPQAEIKSGGITYNHESFLKEHQVACQSCHQDAIQGDGEVPEDRCRTCHNQPEKLERYKETAFIHDNHVTKHNTACFHCHREMRHEKSTAGTKSLVYDCAVCHTKNHGLQQNMYKGIGAKGVAPMASPMYLANVDCVGCHIVKKSAEAGSMLSETFEGSETGCTNCHGKEYAGVIPQMKGMVKETIAKLNEKLAGVKNALDATRSEDRQLRDEIEDVAYNLRFVEAAHGAHNIYYTAQILRDAHDRLSAAAKKAKFGGEDLSNLSIVSGAFCASLCHDRVGVKVPPEKVRFLGKEMPHRRHNEEGIACTVCHTIGLHKDVKLKSPTVCKRCHSEDE